MSNLVYIKQNRCLTNSLKLALTFDKQHNNVLAKIEKQLADLPVNFTELNFKLSEYKDSTGRTLPLYEITKDGFMAIAMTFTGKKAAAFRVAVIEEFNRRGDELQKLGRKPKLLEDLLDEASATIRFEKARADAAEKTAHLALVKADMAQKQVKIQQDNAASSAAAYSLTGQEIFDTYETIRNEVKLWWPDAEITNKDNYKTPGAWTTNYLKIVWKVKVVVKENGKGGMRSLFDRSVVEKVLTNIIKAGG